MESGSVSAIVNGAPTYKRRVPFLAAIATFGAPGLGQFYNGQLRKGALLYLFSFCWYLILPTTHVWQSFSGLSLYLTATLGLGCAVVADAWINARKRAQYELCRWNRWYSYGAIILLHTFVITPLINEALFPRPIKVYKVVSGAMLPTLQIGDRLVADLNAYKSARPQRGDVAFFEYPVDPTKDFVMRVIGLPGEKIEIRDKRVYVNGKPLNELWGVYDEEGSEPEGRKGFGPEIVSPNEYFVMGDNRYKSYDSRFWGTVPLSAFRSRALYIYWAGDKSRIGRPLQ
jgi:signal peptidase I